MKKITKQSKITLVELPPTQFGELNGNPSYTHTFGLVRKFLNSPQTKEYMDFLEGVS